MLLPLVLHWPHLSGWLSENPAFLLSGLAQSAGAGHGVLTGYPGWIDGNAGVTTQALGGLAAQDWLRGVVPWWNPSSGVGLPLAAELQNSAFFLPFVLLLRLFDGVVYLKIVLQIIAGLACRALLAELQLTRFAVLIGAACFELNGSFAWFAHGPIMPIAFLPLLLFGIERARHQPWQGGFWVAVAIGWSLLSGFPETAYLDGLLGLAWALLRLYPQVRAANTQPSLAIATGGLAGVLLAAPPLLAFAQSLPISFIGVHLAGAAVIPPVNRAALLFPYLFGPPLYGGLHLIGPASLAQFIHWYRTTAYLDLPLLALALMALKRHGKQTGLRWLLAIWIAIAMGRAVGVPGVSDAVNLLPLVRNTMFFLYILPSCQLAATVLAALTIDDWHRHGRLGTVRVAGCAAAAIILALAGLPAAWPAMALLRQIPLYLVYPIASVLGGCGCVMGAAWLLSRTPTKQTGRALAVVLAGEAAVLCFLPLLAGTPRPRQMDHAAIAWLAARTTMVRVHAIASLTPNYGAWFGIAAIDDNYLPVPQAWVDDVRATLLPRMDGVNNSSQTTDPQAFTALRASLPALAAHGVGYLLVPPEIDPFARTIATPVRDTGAIALPLLAPLSGTIAASRVIPGRLTAIRVTIGTYAGLARGTLAVRVCQSGHCAAGTADLAQATDNAKLQVNLTPAVDLLAAVPVSYTIAPNPGATRAPALWLWPLANPAPGEAVRSDLAPRLELHLATAGSPNLAYRDTTVAVFQLPQPAPMFEASGCTLITRSPREVRSDCPRPTRLLRRELSYPGWQASQDDQPAVVQTDGIYQSVSLPQGFSEVRFTYSPPGILYAWLAAASGAIGFAALGWMGWHDRWSGRRLPRRNSASR